MSLKNKRKKTPTDYHLLAESRGFRWLGPEVATTKTLTTWECPKGHQWQAIYNNIQQGRHCPSCTRKKTSSDFHLVAQKRNFQWLGPVVTSMDIPTKWKCTHGHEWQTTYRNILRGDNCPLCLHHESKKILVQPDDTSPVLAEENSFDKQEHELVDLLQQADHIDPNKLSEGKTMNNILELKTINELQEMSFFIPSYQRGYRWRKKEVTDLLDDISEFTPKEIEDSDDKTWYCLQPIVVRRNSEEQYEVIDGQQRLTTIYLILYYLNQRLAEAYREKLFDLNYQTRTNVHSFLSELKKDEINEDNIDYYFISSAYTTICNWFNRKNFDINNFQSKFKFNTKVIWYESNEDNPIAIFTRINIGKIPLTNAELIKALFLNSSNFEKSRLDKIRLKQLEISTEWDRIEHALQDDMLWYFINEDSVSTNRIELIFDLMNTNNDEEDNYSTFRFFNEKFKNKNKETIEQNWLEVKNYFQRFQEWFNERELYHKIGFLIAEGETITRLVSESENKTKTEFKEYLNDSIKEKLKGVNLGDLQYGDKKIKTVLLLYNIQTMLNNKQDNSLFPFALFKRDKWDIEHITSVKDKVPDSKQQKENWLNDAKNYIEDNVLLSEISDYQIDDTFDEVYEKIVAHFNQHLKDDDINDISNLTLLDSETNRGYKNAVFPMKRMTIITREKEGTFIPLCTKNAFLKYFSEYPPKMSFWTQEDREKYFKDMEEILKIYLPSQEVDSYNG